MKKLVALLLAALMVFSLVGGALAIEVQESPEKQGFKKNTNDCPMDGLYADTVTLEDGTVRSVLHYYPADLSFRRPVVIIGVDDGVDAAAFLEETGWLAMADEKDYMIIAMLPGENGWQADEIAYTHAVYDYAQARAYYVNDDSAYYMIGYGAAADAAMGEAMTQADLYAGFACLGGAFANAEAWIAAAQTTESEEEGRMQSTVPVPMWIGAAEKTPEVEALIAYWAAADDCSTAEADIYSNKYADEIYMHLPYLIENLNLSDNDPSKVMVSLGEKDYTEAGFIDYLYTSFLFRARRQDSYPIGVLRYAADIVDELGMEYHELDVNGTKEWFYVYVPTAVREGKYDKVPLVYVTHGASGGADEFSLRGGMIRVAEQYNFIMVSTQNNGNADVWKADNDFICANYPVDTTRIYLSGQSAGCSFCLTVAEQYPELIAAVAAASLVKDYRPDALAQANRVIRNEEIQVPIFISVGYLDHHFNPETGSMHSRWPSCGEYWMQRAGIDAQFLGYDDPNLWTNVHTYDFGVYHDWVGLNHQGFPMYRWQRVDGKIHAYTVEEGVMFYEYMVQWSRGADGTLYYMGIPVTAE